MKLFLRQELNSEYFRIGKETNGQYSMDLLNEIKFDEYFIYKSTGKQKEVNKEDVLNMKYSGFMFFKKDLYNKEHINAWIKFIISLGGLQYLIKPFPNFSPYKKIIIKQ